MRESTITDLRAAISSLETERQRIDEQLRALRTTLRYFEGQERVDGPGPSVRPSPILNQTRLETSGRDRRQGTDNSLREEIAEILAAEGTLHRRDIYERLVNRGVQIKGQNPISNVSAHLSIDPRFRNAGRGVWRLATQDDETNGYADDIGSDNGSEEEEEDAVPW